VMAGHAHGGMLEVHGAHVAIKARFATHPEFCDGKLHVPDAPGLGFSLKD
jgi:L-rhamnonate dehydratase